jgi:hypothetical protein
MDIVNELEKSPSNLAQQMPSQTETNLANLTGCLASFFVYHKILIETKC